MPQGHGQTGRVRGIAFNPRGVCGLYHQPDLLSVRTQTQSCECGYCPMATSAYRKREDVRL